MRPTLMIPVLAALVALSCRDGGRPVEPSISADYVQGRVQVDLADTVRYSFAHSFFERLGLDPVFIAADLPFGVLIQVDSSNFDLHISKSISDSAVTTVMKWPSEGINPQRLHVFVMFSGTVRLPYAQALIASIPELSWEKGSIEHQWAMLRVEVGQEQSWIEQLKGFSFISSASLVYEGTM